MSVYNSDKQLRILCDDECGELVFDLWKGNDEWGDELYISYNLPGFYAFQSQFLTKLKALWYILSGKQFGLYEIAISGKNLEKFYENMENFIKNE